MALTHSPRIITDGLVLCLDAANTKSYPRSGTTWSDISNNGNNGTMTNMDGTNFNSGNGGYLTFDGTNEYTSVTISNFFTSFTQQITMEAWIYVPTAATWTNGNRGNIVARGNFDGAHGLWRTTTDNQVSFYGRQTSTPIEFSESVGSIARDAWYQLVGIWNGGPILYINGSLAQSKSITFTTGGTENDVPFEIGRNTAAGGAAGNWFNGNVAGVKIYNRALNDGEVTQNFNALRGRFGI